MSNLDPMGYSVSHAQDLRREARELRAARLVAESRRPARSAAGRVPRAVGHALISLGRTLAGEAA